MPMSGRCLGRVRPTCRTPTRTGLFLSLPVRIVVLAAFGFDSSISLGVVERTRHTGSQRKARRPHSRSTLPLYLSSLPPPGGLGSFSVPHRS
ncbi:hypothetical protein OH77DRAFT_1068673 [Trametes cingulata]|nr:hypothetical protein OH77DRAFT_1068673 [Trametes cingulata]